MVGSGEKEEPQECIQELLELSELIEQIKRIDLKEVEAEIEASRLPVDRMIRDLKAHKQIARVVKGKGRYKANLHWKTKAAKRRKYYAMTDSSDLTLDFEESLKQFEDQEPVDQVNGWLENLKSDIKSDEKMDARSIQKILDLVQQIEAMEREGGTAKWFDPAGPFPISSLPKHKAFFDAGAIYPERLFMKSFLL